MANHGIYDTNAAWALVTNRTSIIRNLILPNLGGLFDNPTLELINCVHVMAMIKYDQDESKILPYAILEMIAPNVPDNAKLTAAASDLAYQALMNSAFPLKNLIPNLTQQAFDAAQDAVHDMHHAIPDSTASPFDINILASAHPVTTRLEATTVLRTLNEIIHGHHPQTHALSMYVLMMVSLLKQGSTTTGYLNKIITGVKSELNIDIEYLEEDIIKEMWINLGSLINENNIAPIIGDWGHWIPDAALRIRLIFQQASGEGLTALSTIKSAYQTAAGFNWPAINAILPKEATAVVAAFNHVGTNPYFGYAKDLGAAKSTNYKSYAWVAKELMIRVFGVNSLKSYKGWVRTPVRKQALETIIEDYNNTSQTANIGPGTPADVANTTLAAAILANTGVP